MFDPVGSTSWPNRNRPYLERLAARLAAWPTDPVIVIVGPGAATRLMHSFLANANTSPSSRLTDLARYADQLLRRMPFLPLVSFEPLEVEQLVVRPHRLAVVDRSSRVLAAVKRDLPHVEVHRADVVASPLPVHGDAVIAFNVVSRTSDPAAAARHIAAAVKPSGLLLMDDRSARGWLAGTGVAFERIDEKIHRRR